MGFKYAFNRKKLNYHIQFVALFTSPFSKAFNFYLYDRERRVAQRVWQEAAGRYICLASGRCISLWS